MREWKARQSKGRNNPDVQETKGQENRLESDSKQATKTSDKEGLDGMTGRAGRFETDHRLEGSGMPVEAVVFRGARVLPSGSGTEGTTEGAKGSPVVVGRQAGTEKGDA